MNLKARERESRAKMTLEIHGKLFALIVEAKDFGKKKVFTAEEYRNKVATELTLRDEDNPLMRTYQSKILEIKDYLKKSDPLDKPWTIGACEKYGIPGDMIPHLIELQKLDREPPQLPPLTIRQARWFSRLYRFYL